jgi:hypothetical protein
MAPTTRGTKRAATATVDEVAFKKVQDSLKTLGVSKGNYKLVVEGVEHPLAKESLTEDCRKMLVSMIAGGLCVPVDERHEHQTLAVGMIGEALSAVTAKMQEGINAEDAKVAEAEAGMDGLKAVSQQAEAAWSEAKAESDASKQALADASKAFIVAKTALAECEEEQRRGDAGLVAAAADKDAIEAVIAGDFAKLRDGDWEVAQAKHHYDAVLAIVPKISLDQSLLTAMQGTMMKKPGDRGPFDEMVVQQLATSLGAKVAELAALLESGAPASAARASAVEAAKAALDAAKAAQQEGAGALKVAQDKQRQKLELMEAAKQKVADCEPNRLQAVEVREGLKTELQTFVDLNVSCYETLKERLSAKRRKLLAAEEAARANEAEAAAAAAAEAAAAVAEQAKPAAEELPAEVAEAGA